MCSRFNQTVHHSFPLFVVLFCFIIFFVGECFVLFFFIFLWGSALCCLFLIYLMYCKIHTTVALTYLRQRCVLVTQLLYKYRMHVHITKRYDTQYLYANLRETKSGSGGLRRFAPPPPPPPIITFFFQKDAKWCILLHFGYKICVDKTLNNRGFSGRTKRSQPDPLISRSAIQMMSFH